MTIKVINAHGMCGFLRPSDYPDNTSCIEVDGTKHSISGAMFHENVAARIIAKRMIDAWIPGDIDIDWVWRVLGYYKHAWRNPALDEPQCWFNSNIFYCEDPIGASYLDHFGVHWIQKFYPDYFPTEADFENAYWDGVTAFGREMVDIRKSTLYSATNEIFSKPKSVEDKRPLILGYDPSSRLPAAIKNTIENVIKTGQNQQLCQSNAFNLP